MDHELKILIENIVLLQKSHHLSNQEMATIMKIGSYSMKKIEKGIFPPKLGIHAVFNLSRFFKLTPSDLFKRIK